MINVAVLSNPSSTGNAAFLPRLRSYCAERPDVFHYEAEQASEIGEALRAIARVRPKVLVINGGDGTVQAALTGLHLDDPFNGSPPPVAVLPNGKTNLIALDLGATGDPIAILEQIVAIAEHDVSANIVERELIALTQGEMGNRPVFGMFLGGAGLADTILFCRHKIYPLGLPNGVSHLLATLAVLFSIIFGVQSRFLPPLARPVRVSFVGSEAAPRRFAFMIVTTLEKMLFGSKSGGKSKGLKFMAVDQSVIAIFKALVASFRGTLGDTPVEGVHVEQGEHIRIESDHASVILDGEEFEAITGRPILLRSTAPVPFLRLAA
jgi:Diacylglycerol kinase catalytic domain